MPIKKESMFKTLKNLSIVTGAVSIAFVLSIALVMSGLNKILSITISIGVAVFYLVYRAIDLES